MITRLVLATTLLASSLAVASDRSQLNAGEFMVPNDTISSPNKKAHLMLQPDGNLVVRRGQAWKWGPVVWASDKPNPNPQILVMQIDGNLVQFTGTAPGKTTGVTWAHNAPRIGTEPVIMRVTDGGELITETPTHKLTWSSSRSVGRMLVGNMRTGEVLYSANKAYFLSMQSDSNLVLFKVVPGAAPKVEWATNKWGDMKGAFLQLKDNGDLCTIPGTPETPTGAALWCTNGAGGGTGPNTVPYMLSVQDDGSLCVSSGGIREHGTALWCRTALPALVNRLDEVFDPSQIKVGDRVAVRSNGYKCEHYKRPESSETIWEERTVSQVVAKAPGNWFTPVAPWSSVDQVHLLTVVEVNELSPPAPSPMPGDYSRIKFARVVLQATDNTFLMYVSGQAGDKLGFSAGETGQIYMTYGREPGGTDTSGNHGFLFYRLGGDSRPNPMVVISNATPKMERTFNGTMNRTTECNPPEFRITQSISTAWMGWKGVSTALHWYRVKQ